MMRMTIETQQMDHEMSSRGHQQVIWRPVRILRVDSVSASIENGPGMEGRKPIVTFGGFEADLHTRELRRNGVRVPLQQQPFLILELLVGQPGELVTREQLRRAIWPQGTFVAFERGLTSAMRKVREALGDRADHPVYIETLTGRGYRFIAPVTIAAPRPSRLESPGWIARVAAVLIVGLSEGGVGPNTLAAERLAAADELSAYACLLKSQGRVEESLAAIRKAHAIAPESARITAEVGLHLHAARRYDDEMTMLTAAVRQDGGSAAAWLHLGLGYARRSQFDDAVRALERAVQISRSDDRIRYWLDWARAQRAG
jgi:DNA-binding winged helix-turn-helix (wHTH) protein